MKEILAKIKDSGHGLHARPASQFVKIASRFPCEITVIKDGIEVNGKSIMGLMMLALSAGSEFSIRASGENEETALNLLMELIEKDFEL